MTGTDFLIAVGSVTLLLIGYVIGLRHGCALAHKRWLAEIKTVFPNKK